MPSVADYQSLITSQHRGRPRFMSELATVLQPLVDIQTMLRRLPAAFDLDVAKGAQLDDVGLWVGVGRNVTIALTGIYFAFDTPGVGWDQGRWKGPFDDTTTNYTLDDESYRLYLRAKIAANHWDGTMAGAQAAYSFVFDNPASRVFVQDNQDLTYSLNVAGTPLDNIQMALLSGGYLPIRAMTVRLQGINTVTITGTALFGFDDATSQVAGWDIGSWGRSKL